MGCYRRYRAVSVMMQGMPRSAGKAHVVRVKRSHVDKQGKRRDYESVYLRRTFREGAKVRKETLANLSICPKDCVRQATLGDAMRWVMCDVMYVM